MLNQTELTIKVERAKLIDTIKANRKKHIEAYKKAMLAYRAKVIVVLNDRCDILEDTINLGSPVGPILVDDQTIQPKHYLFFNIPCPQTYEAEYNEAIEMLEYGTGDDVVELTRKDFKAYVKDEWNWGRSFAESTLAYVQ